MTHKIMTHLPIDPSLHENLRENLNLITLKVLLTF